MNKRGKLEIIRDILYIIKNNFNSIKPTPLLRKSNMSSARFKEYYKDLLEKEFVLEIEKKGEKFITLNKKGEDFLVKYSAIKGFIEEFDL